MGLAFLAWTAAWMTSLKCRLTDPPISSDLSKRGLESTLQTSSSQNSRAFSKKSDFSKRATRKAQKKESSVLPMDRSKANLACAYLL